MGRRDAAIALLITAIWGMNFVMVELVVRDVPPLLFVGLRFLLVALPLVFVVRRPGVPARWVIAIGVFLCIGMHGLTAVAQGAGLPAGLASLVLQMQAPFTLLLAAGLLSERPSALQVTGVVLAAVGMTVIAVARTTSVPLGPLFVALLGALSWSFSNLASRVARPPDAVSLIVWASLVATGPLLLGSLVFEGWDRDIEALAHMSSATMLGIGYVVYVNTLGAFVAWTALFRRHEASVVAPFGLLTPIFGAVFAWIIVAERPSVGEIVGGLIVLVGLFATAGVRPRARLRREQVV